MEEAARKEAEQPSTEDHCDGCGKELISSEQEEGRQGKCKDCSAVEAPTSGAENTSETDKTTATSTVSRNPQVESVEVIEISDDEDRDEPERDVNAVCAAESSVLSKDVKTERVQDLTKVNEERAAGNFPPRDEEDTQGDVDTAEFAGTQTKRSAEGQSNQTGNEDGADAALDVVPESPGASETVSEAEQTPEIQTGETGNGCDPDAALEEVPNTPGASEAESEAEDSPEVGQTGSENRSGAWEYDSAPGVESDTETESQHESLVKQRSTGTEVQGIATVVGTEEPTEAVLGTVLFSLPPGEVEALPPRPAGLGDSARDTSLPAGQQSVPEPQQFLLSELMTGERMSEDELTEFVGELTRSLPESDEVAEHNRSRRRQPVGGPGTARNWEARVDCRQEASNTEEDMAGVETVDVKPQLPVYPVHGSACIADSVIDLTDDTEEEAAPIKTEPVEARPRSSRRKVRGAGCDVENAIDLTDETEAADSHHRVQCDASSRNLSAKEALSAENQKIIPVIVDIIMDRIRTESGTQLNIKREPGPTCPVGVAQMRSKRCLQDGEECCASKRPRADS